MFDVYEKGSVVRYKIQIRGGGGLFWAVLFPNENFLQKGLQSYK